MVNKVEPVVLIKAGSVLLCDGSRNRRLTSIWRAADPKDAVERVPVHLSISAVSGKPAKRKDPAGAGPFVSKIALAPLLLLDCRGSLAHDRPVGAAAHAADARHRVAFPERV